MISSMIRFELRYHFSQVSYKIAAFIFVCFGFILASKGGFGGPDVHRNGPYVIANIVALLSLFSIFSATLFTANVVLRDNIYKMDSVIFTTSIDKLPYFLVRFLGLTISVFSLLVLLILGLFIGGFFVPADQLGPFNLGYFLHPLLVFGVPNVLFCTSLIICTALLTKNVRAIYATGVLLYILYMVASILGNSPLLATSALKVNDPGILPFLIDPFGLSSFFSETKPWTDVQRNQLLFPVKGLFLANRLFWLGFSSLIILVSYKFFNFRIQNQNSGKTKPLTSKAIKAIPFKHYQNAPTGFNYNWLSLKSQFKIELISLFKHIPFMVLLLLWIFLFSVELKDTFLNGPYRIKTYPTTGAIVEELRSIKFALILVLFYAAELIGREKIANVQGLIYTTPIKYNVLYLAKCLTLFVLILVLVTANIGIGIGLQLVNGYTNLELGTYLQLYYYSAFPLFLFVVLIVFIQNLAENKYVGMLLSMIVTFIFMFASQLGLEHYLLRFAAMPDLQFSYFNGFGHYASAFSWYILYWSGLSILLAVLTISMWQSRHQQTFFERLKSIPRTLKKSKYILIPSIVLWLGCGAFIYQQTNVKGKYKNKNAKLAWRINYEKKYKKLANLPQPIIKTVKIQVDLYPNENKYTVKGSYRLKNQSNQPIAKLWISFNNAVNHFEISIPHSKKETKDEILNQQFVNLEKPLQVGTELLMNFSFEVFRSGFVDFDSENSVVKNGSYIELEKFVPHFGYNNSLEINDERSRKQAGLAPLKVDTNDQELNYNLIDFENTISTSIDQQVVTVGALQKTWKSNNRSYFTYKTEAPINFMFALSSAKYKHLKEIYKGLTINLFYLKGQDYNIKSMLQAVKATMDYGNQNFALYPLKHFTLAEIPQYKGAATAYPGVVFNAERINYLSNYSDLDKVDQSFAITAHEVAHQWWANLLKPASGLGDAVLTETLAKYTEHMVLEKIYGKMYLRNYLKDDNQLYFILKDNNNKEMPLAKTYEQNHVHYQKGGLVMYAAKEALGEKEVNGILSELITKHRYPNLKAKASGLVNELYERATSIQQPFINESFNEVIDYNLSIAVLSCKPIPNGQFAIEVKINASKNKQGINKLLAPNMDVDIAVFNQLEVNWDRNTRPVYLRKHHINQLVTKLNLIVNEKPKIVAVDLYGYLLDANQKDNLQEIK
jgi:ABC-2 type transport system permease protein